MELSHEKLAASLTNRADLQEARGRQQHLQHWSALLNANSMRYPELFSREKQENDRNLATIFVINEKLKNLKLQTRSDFLVARYDFLLSVSSLPERGFFPSFSYFL